MNTLNLYVERKGYQPFEYEKIEDLKNEFENRNIKTGQNVTIGQNATIGDYVTIGQNAIIKDGAVIKDRAVIGQSAVIKDGATIGNGSYIGRNLTIKPYAVIKEDTTVIRENAYIKGYAVIKEDTNTDEGQEQHVEALKEAYHSTPEKVTKFKPKKRIKQALKAGELLTIDMVHEYNKWVEKE